MLFPENKACTPDIFTFQETKSSPDIVKLWLTALPGKVSFSHGTSRSRGVLLGVHPRSSVQLISTIEDKEGRYVVAECKLNEEFFTVASVYFEPTISSDLFASLLSDISQRIDHMGHNRVLWIGDFNTALNPDLDTTTTAYHNFQSAVRKRTFLLSLLDTHELTDVWRAINPKRTRYTVRTNIHNHHTVLTRTDLQLTSPALLTSVVSTDIAPAYCSDHNPITLDLVIGDTAKGLGYWKFPDFLLSDVEFAAKLKLNIAQTLQDNREANPSLLWDTVKMNIRGCTIDHLGHVKKM